MEAAFSYCPRIIGKDKTLVDITNAEGKTRQVERWTTFKNRFVNHPSSVVAERSDGTIYYRQLLRNEIINLIAVHGYATAYILKDDTLKAGRSKGINTLGANLLMVDFDNTWSMEDAMQHPMWKKVYFAYSTPSYGNIQGEIPESERNKLPPEQYEAISKVIGQPKRNFRLVFRLHRNITTEELLAVIAGFMEYFPMADQQCLDDARIMFGAVKARVEMPEDGYLLNEEDIQDLHLKGIAWREANQKIQRNRMTEYTSTATNAGGSFDGSTMITLATGEVWTVQQLLESKPLGWKESCYSPFRQEHNPSSFATRFLDTGHLFVFDSGSGLKHTWKGEEPVTRLVLKKKAAPVVEVEQTQEEREITTVKIDKKPTRPGYTPNYAVSLTIKERQQQIKGLVDKLEASNIFFAPEGFGKSFITVALNSRLRKVLFCTQTNEQAEQKAYEFANLNLRSSGFPLLQKPKVQCCLSKDYIFKKNTEVSVIKRESIDPFGLPIADKEATIEAIVEKFKCTVKEADEIWLNEYIGAFTEKPDFNNFDIIVTTMARAEIIAKSRTYTTMAEEWVIIYDDPGYAEVSNLIPFTEAKERQILEHNERIDKKNEGKKIEDQTHHMVVEKKSFANRLYYVRPADRRLGQNFKPFIDGDKTRTIPVVYTTTEELTRFFIEAICENAKVFDFMHELESTNVTLWGTKLVHKKNDGLIILAVDLLKADYPESPIQLIGDGLGQELNHVNNKGQNNLSTQHIVIELSQLHPTRKLQLVDEVTFLTKSESAYTDSEIQGIFMRDQMHQAIGRNSGYREKTGNYQTVVLCDPHYWEGLYNTCRYHPAPWSCQLDIGTGESTRNKVKLKKRARDILNYHGTMPEMIETLQTYVTDPENIFEHPQLVETVVRVSSKSEKAKSRVFEAISTQIQKNQNQNAMLDELIRILSK